MNSDTPHIPDLPAATTPADRLRAALAAPDASTRLQAALTAGTSPHPSYVEPLVARCGVEDDFPVRDMLTWALTRMPREPALSAVIGQLGEPSPLARSQALHTLSKLGEPSSWPAILPEHLHDPDDEVARTAWRAAVAVAPDEARAALADDLAAEFGRGDFEVMRSLSRALVALGGAAEAAVARAARSDDPAVRAHGIATERLLEDPEASFALEPADAARLAVALSGGRGAH